MTMMTILDAAQNGNYFANVAKACGISASEAKFSLEKLCPAIARQLKTKAQNDSEAFEALLDLLDEGGGSSDLDNLTDSEAIADGKAVLEDVYGSPANAFAEMKKLAPGKNGENTGRYFWPDSWNAERLECISGLLKNWFWPYASRLTALP